MLEKLKLLSQLLVLELEQTSVRTVAGATIIITIAALEIAATSLIVITATMPLDLLV